MSIYYSGSTGGFYDSAIHGASIPADKVPVTSANHAALIAGQATGLRIVPDETGHPKLVAQEVIVPSSISMRQCRLQLLADGVLSTINSAVSSLSEAAQIEWEYATEVQRSNPLVPALQAVLSWDNDRADQFYAEASQL